MVIRDSFDSCDPCRQPASNRTSARGSFLFSGQACGAQGAFRSEAAPNRKGSIRLNHNIEDPRIQMVLGGDPVSGDRRKEDGVLNGRFNVPVLRTRCCARFAVHRTFFPGGWRVIGGAGRLHRPTRIFPWRVEGHFATSRRSGVSGTIEDSSAVLVRGLQAVRALEPNDPGDQAARQTARVG